MSTTSGLSVSPELISEYASVNSDETTRFFIASIKGEQIVFERTIPAAAATLEEDLALLTDALEDSIPAYVLARLDDAERSWLFISYVPDTATVRSKMMYASSRNVVTRTLGDQKIKESLYANSKADLTPTAYAAHLKHSSAPNPLSAREAEMAAIKAAERADTTFSGSSARTSHVHGAAGTDVGMNWDEGLREAVKGLGPEGDLSEGNLVVVGIENEVLVLASRKTITIDELPPALPADIPSYSFFAWDHEVAGQPKRDIIFTYACPSGSPIKTRMIYSASAQPLVHVAKTTAGVVVSKKVETSDPADIDLVWLKTQLETVEVGPASGTAAPTAAGEGRAIVGEEKKAFSRPTRPGKKR